ncbi:MAG TPA: retropepsin-like aspartic protease [Pseudosphingobacterium sp.]|nr:retropepsin-like aspartic protease [Pseudosphingobacterium sp.]
MILLFAFTLFLPYATFAQTSKLPSEMQHALEQKNYFLLNDYYKRDSTLLSEEQKYYYKAFLLNAFNNCVASNKQIKKLVAMTPEFPDSLYVKLFRLKQDNEVKTFQYQEAAKTGDFLLQNYGNVIKKEELTDLNNSNKIWKALAQTPPQTVIKQNTRFPWRRDKANLLNIPVTVNNKADEFIFDTGANFSTVSKSNADRLGLEILPVSFDVEGAAKSNNSSLAVGKSLKIGTIEFKNVVFLVIPDEQLSFPQIDYKIDGILGYPVISQLEEVHIQQQSKQMFITAASTELTAPNLAMDNLTPLVLVKVNSQPLPFYFDTGAKSSYFNSNYFKKNRTAIMKDGLQDSLILGGAGGSRKNNSYIVKDYMLHIGKNKTQMPEMHIMTAKANLNDEKAYGTIGQDFIGRFSEMIISFKSMTLNFK